MLGVTVVVADSEDRAKWLTGSGALGFLRLRSGHPDVLPTPEEAAEYRFTPQERESIKAWTSSHVVGSPGSVRPRLEELAERTGADEIMVSTMLHGHDDRLESYRLLADALGLRGAAQEP
jgi:alkanesulfonate monooxygenase SsuD/methylene tetrahydromethanopterin reductase-like flavin-dependent oxidoreductase (luciferase family)